MRSRRRAFFEHRRGWSQWRDEIKQSWSRGLQRIKAIRVIWRELITRREPVLLSRRGSARKNPGFLRHRSAAGDSGTRMPAQARAGIVLRLASKLYFCLPVSWKSIVSGVILRTPRYLIESQR